MKITWVSPDAVSDFHWLIGWLEGEGSFRTNVTKKGKTSVQVCGCTTDKDVAKRAATLLDVSCRLENRLAPYKPIYRLAASGRNAVAWMMALYPWMGERRRAAITHALETWYKRPDHRGRDNRGRFIADLCPGRGRRSRS